MTKETIESYKAFDKKLTCNNFEYKIGGSYEHGGDIEICRSGFHSCTNPFDCLSYYDLCSSRFAIVAASGDIKYHDGGDSKIVSSKIKVCAELKLPYFIISCVDFLIKCCNGEKIDRKDSSKLAASGNYSQLAASGYYSQLAASGNYSKLAASGDSSQLAASGDYSQLAASGNYSQLAASGNSSQLAASGYSSIVMSSAQNSSAKVGKNGTIVLTRWVEKEKRFRVSVGYAGEGGIKADVFYKLDKNGNFIEA